MASSREARRWAYPIAAVALAAVAGDALAVPAGTVDAAIIVAAASACAGILLVLRRRSGSAWAGAALLAFAVGHARADAVYRPFVAADHVAALELPARAVVEGVVAGEPETRPSGLRLVLTLQGIAVNHDRRPLQGRLVLHISQASQPWARGDRLRGLVRLRRPRNFGNPGEFDYERHLARQGIYVSGFSYDDEQLERIPGGPTGLLASWRASVAQTFDANAAGAEGALLKALLLGMSADLPEALRESFARAGVSHILAISGLHIGLVAAVGYGAFRWLLTRSETVLLSFVVPKLAAAAAMVPVILYAGIAGSNVATQRSVAMAALVLGAVVSDRRANLVVALALAAAGLVATSPGVTGEISFQLSFVAVSGLLAATDAFWRWWQRWEDERLLRLQPRKAWAQRFVAGSLVVSLAALLSTAPLVAFHFHRVSFAAPLANLVVTPILGTLVVPLGLVAALTQPFSELVAGGIVQLAALLAGCGIWLVEWIAWLPGASVRVATPPFAAVLAFYLTAVAVVVTTGAWRRRCAVVALAVWASVFVAGSATRRVALHDFRGEVRITFLSVGQGDSAVVEFPGGGVMVVDGGGLSSRTFDVGERLIAPFLWSRGITRVDVLVATHPQWDHYGGLIFLAEEFAPREVWDNGASGRGAGWRRFAAAVARSGARRVAVQRGFEREWHGVRVRVLGPPDDSWMGVNDASVVMTLEFGGQRVLLAGDVEAAGEEALLVSGDDVLRSFVVKVPHHGSATSSARRFVAAVAPDVAVVSAGRDNRFGFPQREVVNRYRADGARVLRTDRAGAIAVRIDASGGTTVQSFHAANAAIDSL